MQYIICSSKVFLLSFLFPPPKWTQTGCSKVLTSLSIILDSASDVINLHPRVQDLDSAAVFMIFEGPESMLGAEVSLFQELFRGEKKKEKDQT